MSDIVDARDMIESFRDACVDFDGLDLPDGAEPRATIKCRELRWAADEIERLRAALAKIGMGDSFVVDETNPNRCIHGRSADEMCALCHESKARAALDERDK